MSNSFYHSFVVSLAAWIVANCDLESIKVLCSDFDNVGIAEVITGCVVSKKEFLFFNQSASVNKNIYTTIVGRNQEKVAC